MNKYERGEAPISCLQKDRYKVATIVGNTEYQGSIPFEIDISKIQKHIGKEELEIRTKRVWEFLKTGR